MRANRGLCLCALLLSCASLAVAQDTAAAASRVAVLHATAADIPADLSQAVDAALLRDLEKLAGIHDPTISPVDYAEIQITLGCEDASRACLTSVAQSVQVDAIVVRQLSTEPGVGARLELTYFDPNSSDEPRHVHAGPVADDTRALIAAVPGLVRQLFRIPEPAVVATAEVAPVPATPPATRPAASPRKIREEHARVAPLTWIALGTGVVALSTGIVLGISADSDYRDFKRLPVSTRAQAEHANDAFDSLSNYATAANVLMPVGAVLLGLGGVLLAIDLSADSTHADESRARLQLHPLRGGAMLSLSAVFQDAPP